MCESGNENSSMKDSASESWPSWIQKKKERYGDFAKALKGTVETLVIFFGVGVAICTLVYVRGELQNSIKQTEAIMQSNRPILTIAPIDASKDIKEFLGKENPGQLRILK